MNEHYSRLVKEIKQTKMEAATRDCFEYMNFF